MKQRKTSFLHRLLVTSVVMVTVAGIRSSLGSKAQSCETPIFLYTGEKLQHIHGQKLTKDHCPMKLTPDGQSIQSVPKLIRRSAAIQFCSSRSARSSGKSGLFVCRIPDCLVKPCQNNGQCRETVDSFECLCTSGFSGKTCEIAIPSPTNPSTPGTSAMTKNFSIIMTTTEIGMEVTSAMSTTVGASSQGKCYHGSNACPAGWDAFESKCYKYTNDRKTWRWHFDHCKNLNATMLVIESKEENDFIACSYSQDRVDIWLGCRCPAGASAWNCPETGATWSTKLGPQDHYYWNWYPGEPNEHPGQDNCLRLHLEDQATTRSPQWKDRGCDQFRYRSVCQMQI